MTRYNAIDPKAGWGATQRDIAVIYPEDVVIPEHLRDWVQGISWHTYHQEKLINRENVAF